MDTEPRPTEIRILAHLFHGPETVGQTETFPYGVPTPAQWGEAHRTLAALFDEAEVFGYAGKRDGHAMWWVRLWGEAAAQYHRRPNLDPFVTGEVTTTDGDVYELTQVV